MKKISFNKIKQFAFRNLLSKLPKKLCYHDINHTTEVLKAAQKLAKLEQTSTKDLQLLKTAALFHDTGYLQQYKNNEPIAVETAKKSLPEFGFNKKQIRTVCTLIMATRLPQKPKTKLQKIICDADLDNLGRKDFFKRTKLLYTELVQHGEKIPPTEWEKQTLDFISQHKYFTLSARTLRQKTKEQNIRRLKKIVFHPQ